MAYPDLYHDESILLNAQNVKVKSVSFEAILTNRRLILVDSKKHLIPPQEILLATLRNVEEGENAIRDPTITLSLITSSGATRQMILTFTKTSGGERKRECDEWIGILKQHLSPVFQHPVQQDTPSSVEPQQVPEHEEPVPPRSEVGGAPTIQAPKKKIEISRPMKKIVDSVPAMPKPIETTSLPTGSFCNRCGNRVPPESAFCNRCGTPVVQESDLGTPAAETAPVPVPPQVIPQEVAPAPVVPQVQVPLPPVFGAAADKKERPIEQVIHSIEPLIEDSVPRTEPAPIIPKHHPIPQAGHIPEVTQPETSISDIKWPVISTGDSPEVPVTAPGAPDLTTSASPGTSPGRKRSRYLVAGVLAIIIIAVVAGVFLFVHPLAGGNTPTPAVTPTPLPVTVATTVATPTPSPVPTTVSAVVTPIPSSTPQVIIPSTGVWVRVVYPHNFAGSVGTPGSLTEVGGTGDQVYQISTSVGTVIANIQKSDGSADSLLVELYKDGSLVLQKSTNTPEGTVDIQANLKPSPTPTPTPTLTKIPIPVTTTVNTTATTTATH